MKFIVFFVCLALSNNLAAQWFQASASAPILNENIDQARELAIKQAVEDALTFSGGAISSLQQVKGGVLMENKLRLNSAGEIKALQIIKESQRDEHLFIDIKVNIIAQAQQCLGSQFPKSVIVSRFSMKVPEQTVDGQIHALHKKTSHILFNQMSLTPSLLNIRHYVDIPLELGEKYNNLKLTDTLNSLSTQYDSQYVVFGEINDLSVHFESKNSLRYWLTNPDRHFYMTLYLYDALQGRLVFTKQYRQTTKWAYSREDQADLNSKRFWEYQYGQAILNSLDQANTDIAEQIQCIIPSARVVAIQSNRVQINLGRKNGLQEGTVLNLSYTSNFKDQFGIERESLNVAQQTMKVVVLYDSSAILTTLDDYPLSNIQINDIARIQPLQ